jgi:hypothetical protein
MLKHMALRPSTCPPACAHFRPEPAGAILLADGLALALAGIGENNLPLNVVWAVCVDGVDHVHCVLQDFAGAGVKHG